ncbi:sensor histidine kinase [Anaeromyxobacter diazotrophicus]|uniref:histidine kinase n=1 Tax=Anaeromyxobacter diazotrophicus TaxID=2590199 RepID=A0A7I9VH39_9BACT|nr:PAS domain-containing sensor histidine kinase [Anaeromyxobacter diazotrophicus]GEJ55712.1 hypothetical protein AMYX_04530 [Anaeromyxobacter diazotrophicus]
MPGLLGGDADLVKALSLLALGGSIGAALAAALQWRLRGRCTVTRAALEASEDRLRWALEATSEIVWDWDLARDTLYHPSWARTYGYRLERTPRTGRELVPFIHPEDMPAFHAEVVKVVEGSQDVFEIEHRVLAGTGEWRWMLGRARAASRDAAGKATRLVGTCTDITEKKRMAIKLQIADRMASLGTLAAGVAHEINTPLAYVLANVDCCLERLEPLTAAGDGAAPTTDVARECVGALRDAHAGAARMRDIVRDLKAFSRVEDDVREPVQAQASLRAALSLADLELRRRARVVLDFQPVPPVLASESRLSQVFLNLLVNAAQAIPEGHPDRHEIRVTMREMAGGKVMVEIRDTGCGIAPEHRHRIFDPFFTTKPAGVGTGLGLSICHEIVSALRGAIEVESEVGQGSRFRVILPAASVTQADVRRAQPEVAPRELVG